MRQNVQPAGTNPGEFLYVRLGLTQTQPAVAIFPLTAFFKKIDALETL